MGRVGVWLVRFQGNELKDGTPISDYNLQNNSTVFLNPKPVPIKIKVRLALCWQCQMEVQFFVLLCEGANEELKEAEGDRA